MLDNFSYRLMKKAYSHIGVAVPGTDDPIIRADNALTVFAAWGDPQIASHSPLRTARMAAACRDIEGVKGKLDAIVLLGDIVEFGRKCEFDTAADLLNSVSHKYDNFFAVPGNHDIRFRNYRSQVEKFNGFVRSVSNGRTGSDDKFYFSYQMNGCRFIMMGSDASTFEGSYISRKQLEWLDSEIGIAEANNEPAFVFNHQTLRMTNGLPLTWLGKGAWRGSIGLQNDKVQQVFENHRNVIFITGHLHFGVSQYNYEDCGCFKSLSLPTVGVVNHGKFSYDSQGYIISVFSDRIEMRARLHGEGTYVDENLPGAKITINR